MFWIIKVTLRYTFQKQQQCSNKKKILKFIYLYKLCKYKYCGKYFNTIFLFSFNSKKKFKNYYKIHVDLKKKSRKYLTYFLRL